MVTTDTLSQVSLFEGLSEEHLGAIAGLCEEMACHRGEVLFDEAQAAERLYILLDGEVIVQVELTSRPENVIVAAITQRGQTFGWSGLVAPYHYSASAVCEADSRLVALDGQALMGGPDSNRRSGGGVPPTSSCGASPR
ncbi:MAG: hypothetical protein MAG451_02374 [Anaerolineales bacterium]|nr:hypothetical protein [Anaerolineales bacterium]